MRSLAAALIFASASIGFLDAAQGPINEDFELTPQLLGSMKLKDMKVKLTLQIEHLHGPYPADPESGCPAEIPPELAPVLDRRFLNSIVKAGPVTTEAGRQALVFFDYLVQAGASRAEGPKKDPPELQYVVYLVGQELAPVEVKAGSYSEDHFLEKLSNYRRDMQCEQRRRNLKGPQRQGALDDKILQGINGLQHS